MPELAEVEYYCRVWRKVCGERVCSLELDSTKRIFREGHPLDCMRDLPGRVFTAGWASGKQMLFQFGRDGWMGVHLGMAGQLLVERDETLAAEKHDHLRIRTEHHWLIFRDPRHFGRIRWETGINPPLWWQQRPPDVLSDEFGIKDLTAFLDRKKTARIKTLLLDQSRFPGIGNWMADELLWRAGIHPERTGMDLSSEDRAQLHLQLREVCQDALRVIAPDWGRPPDVWLFQHRWKDGGYCPRCTAPLHRKKIVGRTACYCSSCQK